MMARITNSAARGNLGDAVMRYKGALPLRTFRAAGIGVAGLGAVGRQVAILLATMGHQNIHGWDFDSVEAVNVGTQGWKFDDLHTPKAAVLGAELTRPGWSTFVPHIQRFEDADSSILQGLGIVFCCVDSMEARRVIWRKFNRTRSSTTVHNLFIDARVGGPSIRILTVPADSPAMIAGYVGTLHSDGAAYEAPCTARMTVYTATVAAGLMVAQMVSWLNQRKSKRPLQTDFLLETTMMLLSTGQ
jgi:sulfur carrier protein ThiS adenylyltransferase